MACAGAVAQAGARRRCCCSGASRCNCTMSFAHFGKFCVYFADTLAHTLEPVWAQPPLAVMCPLPRPAHNSGCNCDYDCGFVCTSFMRSPKIVQELLASNAATLRATPLLSGHPECEVLSASVAYVLLK